MSAGREGHPVMRLQGCYGDRLGKPKCLQLLTGSFWHSILTMEVIFSGICFRCS